MKTTDYYSPLCKQLLELMQSHQQEGYAVLFIFRDRWGAVNFTASKPGEWPWGVFDKAAEKHGAERPLIAFDLKQPFHRQMPEQFREHMDTLDAFAYKPLINIPDRDSPESQALQRKFLHAARAALSVTTTETPRRSPPTGKLRPV